VREVVIPALGQHPRVTLTEPMDYADFVGAMARATLILTDSGGVQEEAPALGTPVLVLRDVTERSEGIASGNARLVGTETADILAAVTELLGDAGARGRMAAAALPYGAGDAARQIVEIMLARFGQSRLVAPPAALAVAGW
jgi:UDP-N-acetylglucosamine 2-epimerase (non-hydrolysing)